MNNRKKTLLVSGIIAACLSVLVLCASLYQQSVFGGYAAGVGSFAAYIAIGKVIGLVE